MCSRKATVIKKLLTDQNTSVTLVELLNIVDEMQLKRKDLYFSHKLK